MLFRAEPAKDERWSLHQTAFSLTWPKKSNKIQVSSPPAWGCFRRSRVCPSAILVFPTRVGVFLSTYSSIPTNISLPHPRGGVSLPRSFSFLLYVSSPPAWGCFRHHLGSLRKQGVFPTRVGVFLKAESKRLARKGLPHPRGGVSRSFSRGTGYATSSPPAWGCFRFRALRVWGCRVFPTRVGVFPMSALPTFDHIGLPHPRGGVSAHMGDSTVRPMSSPPAWGCFLPFFRDAVSSPGLPHPRGGVSLWEGFALGRVASSPPAWGCFYALSCGVLHGCVFPTRVGVFLARRCISIAVGWSSPPAWGCFYGSCV